MSKNGLRHFDREQLYLWTSGLLNTIFFLFLPKRKTRKRNFLIESMRFSQCNDETPPQMTNWHEKIVDEGEKARHFHLFDKDVFFSAISLV